MELVDVRCTDLRAERRVRDVDEPDQDAPTFGLTPVVSEDRLGLKVMVVAQLDLESAFISVEHDVLYTISEPIDDVSDEVMGGLLGTSTILTVTPFVREAFRSLATRIRVDAPLIGLVQVEDLQRAERTEDAAGRIPLNESMIDSTDQEGHGRDA